MCITFFRSFIFFSWIGVAVSEYHQISSNKEKFDSAKTKCENSKYDMLTISTMEEYRYSINNPEHLEVSWLGLEKNTTANSYQWISNGLFLNNLYWAPGHPQNGRTCTVIDTADNQWYSVDCSEQKLYVCFGNTDYSIGSVAIDFYTAVETCQNDEKHVLVTITGKDEARLKDIIDDNYLKNHIWLGLIEDGDSHRWITGQPLTPPYNWTNSYRDVHVHYHRKGHKDEGFHSDNKPDQLYVCQNRTVSKTVQRHRHYYILVTRIAVVFGVSRISTHLKGQTQCAMECSKDISCVRFTKSGTTCRTYGEDNMYHNVTTGGNPLWEKKLLQ